MKQLGYRYKMGLYTAVQSFGLAWQHKILLLYTLSASGISFLASIFLYNAFSTPYPEAINLRMLIKEALCILNPTCNHNLAPLIILAIISFVVLLFSNYFLVSLYHHAGHIMAGEASSLSEALTKTFKKLPLITSWSIIALGIEQLALATSSLFSLVLEIIALILFISVHFATFFTLPLIAYTNNSLKEIIFLSYTIAKNQFVEIIGGGTWFTIIAGLFFIPIAFFWGYISGHVTSSTPLFVIVLGILQLWVRIYLSTSFSLFRGLLYSSYHRANPTLEELYRFPWPLM